MNTTSGKQHSIQVTGSQPQDLGFRTDSTLKAASQSLESAALLPRSLLQSPSNDLPLTAQQELYPSEWCFTLHLLAEEMSLTFINGGLMVYIFLDPQGKVI